MPAGFVFLCTAHDVLHAKLLRSALEARGIHPFIEGEHQRGALGMFGAFSPMRVLVDPEDYARARPIAEEIVGPLDDEGLGELDEEDEPRGGPMRRLEGPEEDEDADEDAESPEELAREAVLARRKPYRKAFIVIGLFLAWGMVHMYAGKTWVGRILAVIALVSVVAVVFLGKPRATLVLGAVYAFDAIFGTLWVYLHNQRVAIALEKLDALAAETPTPPRLLN